MNDIIEEIIKENSKYLANHDFEKAGRNGPYNVNDTPVRNNAHWLITYSEMYKKTGNEEYRYNAMKLACYLCDKTYIGKCGAIKCMDDEHYDDINGLIGQAWVIEACVTGYEVTHDERLLDLAEMIWTSQSFSEKKVWERIDTSGKNIGVDYIYNHQLWFAAAGSMLQEKRHSEDREKQITDFLDISVKKYFLVGLDGLIWHSFYANPGKTLVKNIVGDIQGILFRKSRFNIRYLEKGYQLFNLFGFATLYKRYKDHPLFKTLKFKRALNWCTNEKHILKLYKASFDYREGLRTQYNYYAVGYNAPAFELPYILKAFNKYDYKHSEFEKKICGLQVKYTYDSKGKGFNRNTHDAFTLNARIYEYIKGESTNDEDMCLL